MIRSIMLAGLFLCALPAFAQPKAVVQGPENARPGDLVVLTGQQSEGKGFRWVTPAGVQTLSCDPKQIAFATGSPGIYEFMLIVADESAAIDFARFRVIVGDSSSPAPAPVPDQPTPQPGRYGDLLELSKQEARALHDGDTAERLSDAIKAACDGVDGLCEQGRCPTLDGAKRIVVSAIEFALSERSGPSLRVNWLDGWRKPIDQALKTKNPVTVAEYVLMMRAIAIGIDES